MTVTVSPIADVLKSPEAGLIDVRMPPLYPDADDPTGRSGTWTT